MKKPQYKIGDCIIFDKFISPEEGSILMMDIIIGGYYNSGWNYYIQRQDNQIEEKEILYKR